MKFAGQHDFSLIGTLSLYSVHTSMCVPHKLSKQVDENTIELCLNFQFFQTLKTEDNQNAIKPFTQIDGQADG